MEAFLMIRRCTATSLPIADSPLLTPPANEAVSRWAGTGAPLNIGAGVGIATNDVCSDIIAPG